MTDFSRFTGHYFLHDRGAPEDAERIADIMAKKVGVGSEFFKLPLPPYQFNESASALESYQWLRRDLLPEVMNDSVIFGIGLGGLLAARLQEDFPAKNISVVAINSPTTEGAISLANPMYGRIAIYSSACTPIKNYCNWRQFTPQAYDLPWLVYGIKNTKFGLAYLLTSYMQTEDMSAEVEAFIDSTPAIPKAKSAV